MASETQTHARGAAQAPDPSSLMDTKELCSLLRKSDDTVLRWLKLDLLPAPLIVRGGRRWDRAVIARWVAAGCPSRKEFEAREAARQKKGGRP